MVSCQTSSCSYLLPATSSSTFKNAISNRRDREAGSAQSSRTKFGARCLPLFHLDVGKDDEMPR